MRNAFIFALKMLVSGVLLYFAFAYVKFDLIGRQINHPNYAWLAAAVLILIARVALGALRWQRIVSQCDTPDTPPFTMASAFRYTFIAVFFNQTLPSTVGGDAVRIWLLARDQGSWRTATYSGLIDRLAGVLALALLVTICLPWSFALIGNIPGRIALLIVGFGSIGACVAFLALGFVRWRWLDSWWLTCAIAAAAVTSRRVFGSAMDGPPIIAYSLIIHFMAVTAAWCVAKSLAVPLE